MADAAKDFRKNKQKKKDNLVKGAGRIVILTASAFALIFIFYTGFLFFGSGPKAKEGAFTVFTVEEGDGASTVADNLKKDRLLRSKMAFKVFAHFSKISSRLTPGDYEIPSAASPLKIIEILDKGDALKRKVTIPEGWTVGMAFKRIEDNELLSGEMPKMPKEGYMAPDTYNIKKGQTRAELVDQMVARQNKILDELWLERSAGIPIRSKEEALILASIVEKETGIAEERPMIAAVFSNRLKKGMRLQSDPTIIYGITKGLPIGRKILKSEIRQDHPWNTYVIHGLPQTPICNPGKEAIKAVLNPPASKNLFFVADGTGGHVFAETYEDHQKNVEKWRKIRADKESMEQSTDPQLDGGNLRLNK